MNINSKISIFENKLDNIVTDILNSDIKTFLDLQNPKICGDISLFFEDELNQKFSRVELEGFTILLSNRQTECSKPECPEVIDQKITSKERKSKNKLCKLIAIFYIRILNVIAAIIAAIDPQNNLCLQRLNSLFKTIDENRGAVTVCNSSSELYPTKFLSIRGMEELLRLYNRYNFEDDLKSNQEKKSEIEFLKLKLKEMFSEISAESYNNEISPDDEVLKTKVSSIGTNVEKLKKNVASLGKKITNSLPQTPFSKATSIQKTNNNEETEIEPVNVTNLEKQEKNPNRNPSLNEEPNLNLGKFNFKSLKGGTIKKKNKVKKNKSKKNKCKSFKKNNNRNESSKKSKKKHKGGAFIIKKLKNLLFKENEMNNQNKLSKNVQESRTKYPKRTKEFLDKIKSKQVSSKDLQPDSKISISYIPQDLSKTDMCVSGKLNIEIEKKNLLFAKFFEKHKEFQNHYYNSSVDFIDYLHQQILKEEENGKFTIKKINISQLNAIEKNVRKKLVDYYALCSKLFNESFDELKTAVGIVE